MIHPNDEQSLQRMLGVDEIPAKVAAEYAVRLTMYHGDGNSGPLGSLGLIPMVRSLGLGPAAREPDAEVTDWRTVPADGSARIEANYMGSWCPGVFLGFVADGTLAVRLDEDDGMVRECRRHMVRLTGVVDPEFVREDDTPPHALLPDAEASEASEAEEVREVGDTEEVVEDDGELIDIDEPPEKIAVDARVWIENDKETLDGTLVEVGENSKVLVLVDDEEEPREFEAADVVSQEAPAAEED